MKNRWSESDAAEFVMRYKDECSDGLALRTYSSRLLGSEKSLVLHGGGNTSVKAVQSTLLNEDVPAIFVKASGIDMAAIEPDGHPGLVLSYLLRLRSVAEMDDAEMINEFRTHLFDWHMLTPSIETLVHAFIPKKYIDHTHADAVLTLTNQKDGERIVREAFGDDVIALGYVKAGFNLAKAAADAFDANPRAKGMILISHGIITWGDTARESYEAMIELVTRAEEYIAKHSHTSMESSATTIDEALDRLTLAAPILRGLLASSSDESGKGRDRVVLLPLINKATLDFVDSKKGKELALTPPITPDHLIRTKALPMWVDSPNYGDLAKLKEQLSSAVANYLAEYDSYVERHSEELDTDVERFDSLPRVVMMPGLGALCTGNDVYAAEIARDITAQSISVKSSIAAMGGTYQGLSEKDLFGMEYYSLQHAKLCHAPEPPLTGEVAVVTGAAGAIGSGICRGLLKNGCHVAVTDLPGERLDAMVDELAAAYPSRVIGVPLDVTDPESVRGGLEEVIRTWGGIDIAIINAGIAMVCSLADMDVEDFRRLERINIEGTLLLLREMARHYALQGTGGDIIVISTKNVFAPGAKFGAYSATKAASHQLARIASLEFADMDVRVNMVAPDAVFSDGERKSGLWQEVGPDRIPRKRA